MAFTISLTSVPAAAVGENALLEMYSPPKPQYVKPHMKKKVNKREKDVCPAQSILLSFNAILALGSQFRSFLSTPGTGSVHVLFYLCVQSCSFLHSSASFPCSELSPKLSLH